MRSRSLEMCMQTHSRSLSVRPAPSCMQASCCLPRSNARRLRDPPLLWHLPQFLGVPRRSKVRSILCGVCLRAVLAGLVSRLVDVRVLTFCPCPCPLSQSDTPVHSRLKVRPRLQEGIADNWRTRYQPCLCTRRWREAGSVREQAAGLAGCPPETALEGLPSSDWLLRSLV
jgi:hypothetical protein